MAVLWTFLAYGGAVLIGLCGIALYGPEVVQDTEMLLPFVLTDLFPWWLAAILLAGVVAAMVSTAQSMLLVAASSISQDVYNGVMMKGGAEDRSLLTLSRVATLLVGVLGLVLALTTSDLIYHVVSYAWAGIGCSFAPAVLLSFYWDRFSASGVVTALASGLTTTVLWIAMGWDQTITARGVTFVLALGLSVLVTFITRRGEPDRTALDC